jgi:hypothetical protein
LIAAACSARWLTSNEALRGVRLLVACVYFFAGLHKLNYDYLNLQTSCLSYVLTNPGVRSIPILQPGAFFYSEIPFDISETTFLFAAFFSIGVEFLMSYALVTGRFLLASFPLALVFHGLVGFNELVDFSMFMMFSFILIAPKLWFDSYQKNKKIIFSLALLTTVTQYMFFYSNWTGTYLRIFSGLVWGGVLFFLLKPIVLTILNKDLMLTNPSSALVFFSNSARFVIMPLLFMFLLLGFSPYVGLTAKPTFSMYSNLRTEGGVTNHLLIPADVQIFPYLKYLSPNSVSAVKYGDHSLDLEAQVYRPWLKDWQLMTDLKILETHFTSLSVLKEVGFNHSSKLQMYELKEVYGEKFLEEMTTRLPNWFERNMITTREFVSSPMVCQW